MHELLVKSISRFVSPSQEEWHALNELITARTYKAKETYLAHGAVCRHLAFVTEGLMQVYQFQADELRTLNFFGKGAFFSSTPSFQLQVASEGTYQAIVDTGLLLIERANLYALFDRYKTWERLGRLMAEQNLIEIIALKNALNFKTPSERLKDLLDRHPQIRQQASQQQIASYLGISRAHYTRVLKQF